jgi:hypothetical protein
MGVSGQRHAPAALYLREKDPGTHWIGSWVGLRAGLDIVARRKSFASAENRTRSSSPCQTVYLLSYPSSFPTCWWTYNLLSSLNLLRWRREVWDMQTIHLFYWIELYTEYCVRLNIVGCITQERDEQWMQTVKSSNGGVLHCVATVLNLIRLSVIKWNHNVSRAGSSSVLS